MTITLGVVILWLVMGLLSVYLMEKLADMDSTVLSTICNFLCPPAGIIASLAVWECNKAKSFRVFK